MIEVKLLNKNNTEFIETFDSEYLLNKFLNKVKKSKALTLVSITYW